jgi:hypothetical protein
MENDMKRHIVSLALAVMVLPLPHEGLEATLIIGSPLDATPADTTHPADGIGNSVADASTPALIVGAFTTPTPSRRASVFVFDLPTLADVSTQLMGANFSAWLFAKQNTGLVDYNVDLYALRISDPADGNPADDLVLASDYGAGASPSGTLLQDNWVTLASPTTRINTDASGDAALLSFLQNNWVNGGRLFLRGNADTIDFNDDGGVGTDFAGYQFGSGDHATDRPELTLDIIPEPHAGALILLGALLTLLGRRR